MGAMSITHWLIVSAVVLVLFGKGKLSAMMGDVGQGLRSFRQGLAHDDTAQDDCAGSATPPARLIAGEPPSQMP